MAYSPLTPGSITTETSSSDFIKCRNLSLNNFTDGILTINGTLIDNIETPVNPTDIVTKEYADSLGYFASGPENSVQFNKNSSFAGTNNFLFTEDSIFVPSVNVNNLLYIQDNTITGLSNPVTVKNPLTKGFVDSYLITGTQNSISVTGSHMYTGIEMVSQVIFRNSIIDVSDSTDTATNIKTYMNSVGITECHFYLANNGTSNVILTTGSGVVPSNVLTIYPNYTLSAVLSIQSSTLYFFILSVQNTEVTSNFVTGPRSLYTISDNTFVLTQFQTNTAINEITSGVNIYSPTTIQGIIHRKYEGSKIDSFENVSNFISGYSSPNSPIYYIFADGGVEMVIKNTSTVGNITFASSTGWTIESGIIITPGKTGYLYVVIENGSGFIYYLGSD